MLGNIYQVADTLDRLGESHAALGETGQGRAVWRDALKMFEDQGRRDKAARVRLHLASG